MNRIKVSLAAVIAALTMVPAFAAGDKNSDSDRQHVLKIYNWADYIDEDLLYNEFPKWYKEQTGEDIKIVYSLFDINEIMLTKIEKGHEDYDVACPSDYIIERMLRNDLLLPLNKDFGDTPNYLEESVSPFAKMMFSKLEASGKDANDYAVGYMWGTTGFLYNTAYVNDDEVTSWSAITNPKFAGHLFVKDAFRDVYGPLLMMLRQDDLNSGKVTRHQLAFDTSDESIALVEEYLKSCKENIAGWEQDFGKERMVQGKGWLNLTWSGDASWAIEEAAELGVDLRYTVPQEGSNYWFDGWVIPKYAKNQKAANYFINFMCKPENAIRNMNEIGYVSVCASPEILEAMEDPEAYPETVNVSYMFGEGADSLHLNPVMYPDQSVIDRCDMMHDSGDRTDALLEMWSRVKGDNMSMIIYVVIAVAILAVAYAAYASNKKKKSHRRKTRR